VDIQTAADIKILVDGFYEKVNDDPLLGPIFNEVAGVDWPAHLETLYAFWESMLFGTASYQGAPFPKHSVLPVEKAHFDRWLELFLGTVDENFSGPKAEEAKGRALSIADTFARRMGLLPNRTVLLQP
jgi:hemoglobin